MTKAQRWLLVALIAAAAAGAAWQLVPLADAQARLAALPAKGIGYDSSELPVTDGERAVFGDASVLKREYRVGKEALSVTVIDGTRNRHAVHDPMLCVRGAGWTVTARQPFPLPGGEGELVAIARDGETSEVLYWFSDGTSRYASATSYWIAATLRRLSFGASGDEPVLVLVQAEAGRGVDWRRLINDRLLALTAF